MDKFVGIVPDNELSCNSINSSFDSSAISGGNVPNNLKFCVRLSTARERRRREDQFLMSGRVFLNYNDKQLSITEQRRRTCFLLRTVLYSYQRHHK